MEPSASNFPIDWHLRVCLRGRIYPQRSTVYGKPGTEGDHEFHMIYCYLCQHYHLRYFHGILQPHFINLRNVRLPLQLKKVIVHEKVRHGASIVRPTNAGTS